MRRWFIALFTAHFLLSVLGFAFGPLIKDAVQSPPVIATVELADTSLAEAETAAAETGVEHALGDDIPELPDAVQRATLHVRHPAHTPVWSLFKEAGIPKPVLASMDRPPRRA